MSWDELASLDPDLITIGSHSMTHAMLTPSDDEQLTYEVEESRRQLAQRLQRPVEYFSYPNGRYDETAVRVVSKSYRAAVTTAARFVTPDDDLHLLPRIAAGEERVRDLAWRLHRPTA
jgi:peptidoglycan/xylan/chitin deacetylase (PgdA/CDA1 family)